MEKLIICSNCGDGLYRSEAIVNRVELEDTTYYYCKDCDEYLKNKKDEPRKEPRKHR